MEFKNGIYTPFMYFVYISDGNLCDCSFWLFVFFHYSLCKTRKQTMKTILYFIIECF